MDYELHLPDYIANCINKDRPELHCNGQCELMKKVREQEKENAKKNLLIYEYSSLYMHKDYLHFEYQHILPETRQKNFTPNLVAYSYTHLQALFRPPIQA
ncbi:hypothetical protein ACFRAE_05985 [Sphingobacterium sp. HJSM2_6]|uniref:hypothetical protein n=1 Tax=Sphingobacterium sp. HJSM2_6 TaxID=3366264 RepID=UPI003BE5E314